MRVRMCVCGCVCVGQCRQNQNIPAFCFAPTALLGLFMRSTYIFMQQNIFCLKNIFRTETILYTPPSSPLDLYNGWSDHTMIFKKGSHWAWKGFRLFEKVMRQTKFLDHGQNPKLRVSQYFHSCFSLPISALGSNPAMPIF